MEYKVVLVNGSPRLGGNTELVLACCAEVLEKAGLKAQICSLRGLKISGCIACGSCCPDGNCVLDDGANQIFAEIATAQGLIIGTPVYYGTARGDVMSFVQRLSKYSACHGRFLDGMVGGPIAVARRGGHTATIQELLMFCLINGMVVPGANYWNMVFGLAKGEAADDEEGLNTARLFAANLARLVKKLNA